MRDINSKVEWRIRELLVCPSPCKNLRNNKHVQISFYCKKKKKSVPETNQVWGTPVIIIIIIIKQDKLEERAKWPIIVTLIKIIHHWAPVFHYDIIITI